MNRIDEYKDKINWDIWEDIQRVEGNAEEKPHENSKGYNSVSFKHMGFTYRGEWGNESNDILHTIIWPDNRSTPFPYSPNNFPSRADVESFVEKLIAEQ